MKAAILSDIHGNKVALDAVLQDIDHYNFLTRHPIDQIWCLGDTVGYGPKPRECLETVQEKASINLLGNHEDYVVTLYDWALQNPDRDYPFAAFRINGEGAVEGTHLALRRLYGDNSAIGEDRAQRTGQLIQAVSRPHYKETLAEEITTATNDKPSLLARITQPNIVENTLKKLLSDPNIERLINRYHERVKQKERGDAFMAYLRDLQPAHRVSFDTGDALLVHDNPFTPGIEQHNSDSEVDTIMPREWHYLWDPAVKGRSTYAQPTPLQREDITLKPQQTNIAQVFANWDDLWPNTRFILFGHTHYPGVYTQNGKHLCNPGSVGMPRFDGCVATYAILDTDAAIPFHIRRVEFDYTTVIEQMQQAGLPNKFKQVLRRT